MSNLITVRALDNAVAPPAFQLKVRADFLAQVPEFSGLSREALDSLAFLMREERHAPGAIVVSEGELGELLYVVVEGRAEVSTHSSSGKVPLATLGPREVFGEIGLLSSDSHRQATVTALTPLATLTLSRSDFAQMRREYPELEAALARDSKSRLTVKFLKTATPFREVDLLHIRKFSECLREIAVARGEVIMRQGESGDACYLVRSGRVEVVVADADGERVVATPATGSLIGEMALLTDAPRSATVRALEPTELLVLRRTDLMEILGKAPSIAGDILQLLRLRARPRQAPGVIASQAANGAGEVTTTLKDCRRYQYYRLSPEGWFIWERLDGRHTVRDLALDYFFSFKKFAPQFVAETVAGLSAAGFAEITPLRADVLEAVARVPWLKRALHAVTKLLRWQAALDGIDPIVTRLYAGGVRLLYTVPAQAVLGIVNLTGLAVFLYHGKQTTLALFSNGLWLMLISLLPAYLLAILIHEAGHAFTVKAFGYEVPRVGIGWHWLSPVAFVDTSDMWMAPRWPRVAVSLAGPYTNVLLAALAALGASFTAQPRIALALWVFSATSYLLAVFNLNPLLEFDGYYVLMDLLERPNLRSRALAWLGSDLLKALRHPQRLRGHLLDLAYGAGCLFYVIVVAGVTALASRAAARQWLAGASPLLKQSLPWMMVTIVVLILTAGIAVELRDSLVRDTVSSPRG